GTYHETQFTKTQRGTRKQGLYIHTQATDNEGQVRTIKAGQTDTGGLNKGNQQDTGETNDTHNPGDWEQVRGGDTDNNEGTWHKQTKESTWQEQGLDKGTNM